MAQKPAIAIQNTVQFLREKFNEDVQELMLLSGGEWSQAYSFVHHHKKYVLRWCHSSETFEKDAAASIFNCEAMPIPQITDTGKAFDTYFAISEFAEGEFIDTLSPGALQNALPALFNLFDALRSANLAHTTGYGGWNKDGVGSHASWKAFLLDVRNDHEENFLQGWYAQLANSSIGTAAFDHLYAQFEGLVEKCPEVRELIHSDLLHYNLLVSDAKISAVIDWQCSLYGDSLYDVAWFIYYAPYYPHFATADISQKILAHFESASAEQSNLKARLMCYQLHIGLGSIAYNTFKKDWKAVQEVIDFTRKVANQMRT